MRTPKDRPRRWSEIPGLRSWLALGLLIASVFVFILKGSILEELEYRELVGDETASTLSTAIPALSVIGAVAGFWLTWRVFWWVLSPAWTAIVTVAVAGGSAVGSRILPPLQSAGVDVGNLFFPRIANMVRPVARAFMAAAKGLLSGIIWLAEKIGTVFSVTRSYLWLGVSIYFRFLSRSISVVLRYAWLGISTPFIYLGKGIAITFGYLWLGVSISFRFLSRGIAIGLRYAWLAISTPFIYSGKGLGIALKYLWLSTSVLFRYLRRGLVFGLRYLWIGISIPFIYTWKGLRLMRGYLWLAVYAPLAWSGKRLAVVFQTVWAALVVFVNSLVLKGLIILVKGIVKVLLAPLLAVGWVILQIWAALLLVFIPIGELLVAIVRSFGRFLAFVWSTTKGIALALRRGLAVVVRYAWLGISKPFIYLSRWLVVALRYTWLGISMPFIYLGRGLGIALKYLWLWMSTSFRYLGRGLAVALRYAWLIVSAPFVYLFRGLGIALKYLWRGASTSFRYLGRGLAVAVRYAWLIVSTPFVYLFRWLGIALRSLWLWVSTVVRYLGRGLAFVLRHLWLGISMPLIYAGKGVVIALSSLWALVSTFFRYLATGAAFVYGVTSRLVTVCASTVGKAAHIVSTVLLSAAFAGLRPVGVAMVSVIGLMASAVIALGRAIRGATSRALEVGSTTAEPFDKAETWLLTLMSRTWNLLTAVVTPRVARAAGAVAVVGGVVALGIFSWGALRGEGGTESPGALTIAYSPEKEPLFLRLVEEFNRSLPPDTQPVYAVKLDMADMLEEAVAGEFAAISPDSSVWLAQLDRLWQERNPGASPLVGSINRYALSPVVIAMWASQAQKMGHPGNKIGWADLMERGSTDSNFKWSHPSPTTASGLLATTAEFYAGAGKSANLTIDDLQAEATIKYVKAIEATVGRYGGESEDKMVARLLQAGTISLDAFVAQEQLVIFFNINTQGEKLVAIYPKEGTFWMDHPLALLEGPWVTPEQRRGFREFAKFVAETEQQRLVLAEGYRPAKLTVSLQEEGSLIRPEYNVDPNEPKTLLKVPSPPVLAGIREAWRLTKRPANIYLVVDVSGSMRREKLSSAKDALVSFIDQIEGDQDQVALVAFSSNVNEIERLGPINKASFTASIQGLEAGGSTLLYDAVAYAHDALQEQGDTERNNVIVAMTDGKSDGEFSELESKLNDTQIPVLIFTVAYGEDADMDALTRIALLGNGQAYEADPRTLIKLYILISTFF